MENMVTEIVIFVEGGMVQSVMSTDPSLKVWIADRDIDGEDEAELEALEEAEERGKQTDMSYVY